ncbi:MAG: BamA/TamA family outer membrane protein [Bradymonadales bacterium]|jgi:outer membrane protein assembly factor BamA
MNQSFLRLLRLLFTCFARRFGDKMSLSMHSIFASIKALCLISVVLCVTLLSTHIFAQDQDAELAAEGADAIEEGQDEVDASGGGVAGGAPPAEGGEQNQSEARGLLEGGDFPPYEEEKEEDSVEPEAVALSYHVVADLQLECEIPFCKKAKNVEALLRATGLHLGQRVSSWMLAASSERLRQTGYFSNIEQHLEHDGQYVSVRFKTVGHDFIRKVIIDSPTGGLYDREIKKRMILRPGAALYPRSATLRGRDLASIDKAELIKIALDDQTRSLQRVYEKEGYLDAEIELIAEEVEPYLVDLRVKVRKVKGYTLGKVYVRGRSIMTYDEIDSAFRSAFGFFSNITKEAVEDGAAAVLKLYREAGYIQTRLDYVTRLMRDKKTVDVFLELTEAPQWLVHYEGNTALSKKELDESITLYSSGYVDQGELDASVQSLRNLYISAGYYWAEVKAESIRPISNTPGIIIFTITENERTEIGEIVFDGAGAMKHSELMGVIKSKEYQAFGSGAYPQRSMIADDAAKIVDAYRARGYLNADVSRWVLEPIDKGGRLRLTFVIHEGSISRVAHKQVRYVDRAGFETHRIFVSRSPNDYFDDFDLRSEQAQITKQLRSLGYAEVMLKTHCVSYDAEGELASDASCDIAEFPVSCFPNSPEDLCEVREMPKGRVEICQRHYQTEYGEESGELCQIKNGVSGLEVDVDYEISLGSKYSVGDKFYHGNTWTETWVIKQDLPFETGDVFDYNKIMEARSLMRSRSIYNSASVNTIGVDSSAKFTAFSSVSDTQLAVPIVVDIEEGARRWMDFALGVSFNSGDWLLTSEVEYVEANLAGWGWDLRVLLMPEMRFVNRGNEFVLTRPFNQNWFTLISLNVPIAPSKGLNLITQLFYDLRYIPDTKREELGGNLELQWKINSQWFSALSLGAKSAATASLALDAKDEIAQYDACYPVTFFQNCPFRSSRRSQIYSLSPRISYERRDSPLNPKYGVFAEFRAKLAYSDVAGFFFKPELRASYTYTFLELFTLAFNTRFGMTILGKHKRLPFVDRYFLGGLNMRGYANEALGPRLVDSLRPSIATNEAGGGETMLNLSFELRFPIWKSMGIYSVLFLDSGSLLDHQPSYYGAKAFARALFVDAMRYTAGLGIRWLIGENIPPIVLDYGFLLNRKRGDPLGGFSLNVGYTF